MNHTLKATDIVLIDGAPHPVGDEIEKRTIETMDEARDPDRIDYSAQMRQMFEQINEILKNDASN